MAPPTLQGVSPAAPPLRPLRVAGHAHTGHAHAGSAHTGPAALLTAAAPRWAAFITVLATQRRLQGDTCYVVNGSIHVMFCSS